MCTFPIFNLPSHNSVSLPFLFPADESPFLFTQCTFMSLRACTCPYFCYVIIPTMCLTCSFSVYCLHHFIWEPLPGYISRPTRNRLLPTPCLMLLWQRVPYCSIQQIFFNPYRNVLYIIYCFLLNSVLRSLSLHTFDCLLFLSFTGSYLIHLPNIRFLRILPLLHCSFCSRYSLSNKLNSNKFNYLLL